MGMSIPEEGALSEYRLSLHCKFSRLQEILQEYYLLCLILSESTINNPVVIIYVRYFHV